jgi:REP element-mobilizing transposase RayT
MHFLSDGTYHVYNRSNETIFFGKENYLYFLRKVNQLLKPHVDFLCWCLMPNHFHFLLVAKESGCLYTDESHRPNVQILSKNIGTLLSSYAKALNKERGRKGKLFARDTQAKNYNEVPDNENLLDNSFHYIHQNPLRAGLCSNLRDWEFSSYLDYAGLRNGKLINLELAHEMINIDKDNFESQSKALINEDRVNGMW